MPSVHQKEKILEGRGDVLSYKQDPSVFFYREWIKDRRAYRSEKLIGATNIEDAKTLALEIAFKFAGKDVDSNKTQEAVDKRLRTQPVERAVDNFLNYELQRVEAGIIKYSTYQSKYFALVKHMVPYLKNEGVVKTRQITETTFHNYLIYRKGISKLTWTNELRHMKDFLFNWLVKYRLITPEVVADRKLFPKVAIKMKDLSSNPAINKDDWMILNREIRRWVKEGVKTENHRVHLWRYIFWHFTLISKHTGARPAELMKLRWKDVEIRDVGRISATKKQEEIEELEAEGIEVVDDGVDDTVSWAMNPEELGREERLIAYVTVSSSKTGQSREIPTNIGYAFVRLKKYLTEYLLKHNIKTKIDPNSLVFGNLNNYGRAYCYRNFDRSWRDRRLAVQDQLRGHKFSDEIYTIYSMRSTFIEDKLLEGLDIFLLARVAGHDPKILMKHYERLDIRVRAEEITSLPFGKRDKRDIKVNLF